jgi:hypothetical protein
MEREADLSRWAACGYWQGKRALDGWMDGLGPIGAHGRRIGAMEMGMSQGLGAMERRWVQGNVAVGRRGFWQGAMGMMVAMGAVAWGMVLPVEDL